jgi:hypothetical protein
MPPDPLFEKEGEQEKEKSRNRQRGCREAGASAFEIDDGLMV